MQKEKWKRCKLDSNYLVSSWARIYSLKTEQFIKPYVHKSRSGLYLRISLSCKKHMVHILVGETFLKPIEGKDQINHKDRNTLNCNLHNLERDDQSGNILHMYETNTFTWGGKERNVNNKQNPKK